jgi:hypothetical protein
VVRRISMFMFVCLLSFGLMAGPARGQKASTSASENLHVDAPLAQALVDKVMAQHSDIGKVGIHAVPPGATDNVIIACNIRSKNGKKSSPADLEKLAAGKPVAARVDDEKIFDLLIPMTDAHGGDLSGGFVVMEVPFSKASSEEDALKIGVAVRDELQAQIPNKTALYQR